MTQTNNPNLEFEMVLILRKHRNLKTSPIHELADLFDKKLKEKTEVAVKEEQEADEKNSETLVFNSLNTKIKEKRDLNATLKILIRQQ
jgi:phage-related tail protein